MNLLTILGSIGGTLFLISWIINVVTKIHELSKKYAKYKDAYEELKTRDDEDIEKEKEKLSTIGFKTKKENDEIQSRLNYLKKIEKIGHKYYDTEWGVDPDFQMPDIDPDEEYDDE